MGWNPPRITMQALLRSGSAIRISLNTMCTADCLKIDNPTKKGHPGATVACSVCLRSYHIKCMESEGVVASGLKKGDIIRLVFVCGACGGTAGSNHVAHTEDAEPPHHASEVEPATDALPVRPGKRRHKKQNRK